MIKILLVIIVLLALLTGGDRTAKALITAAINCLIFAGLIFFNLHGAKSYDYGNPRLDLDISCHDILSK